MDILTDKQLRSYDKLSRYLAVPLYYNTLDNKYIYGLSSHLKTNTSYTSYKILPGDTLDSIALAFYGNPTYYWILADFNRLIDSFISLQPGTIIKVPNKSAIEFEEN